MSDIKQILVVDDDRAMIHLLRDFLQKQGYQVATTSSVAGAMSWMENLSTGMVLDLVLSDVQLGTASGIDLARHLQSEHPNLPVILFSVFEEHEKEALKSGARLFLRKPFSLSRLAKELENHLVKVQK